jgi:hypothetical protein
MTTRADFTDDEWRLVLEGPTSAGMLVVTASKGGMFRETFAMSKAYAEARAEHGQSELLDAVVATNPKVEHVHADSPEAARERLLGILGEATALVAAKAGVEELGAYRRFVIALSEKVASAHREHGVAVDDAEARTLGDIQAAIGVPRA